MTIKKIDKKLSFIRTILATLTIFSIPNIFGALEETWHFDTELLKNPKEVRAKLITEENFQPIGIDPAIEVREKSPDGQIHRMLLSVEELNRLPEGIKEGIKKKYTEKIKIKGLLKLVENAKATIIFTPGFHPGVKEGFAPLEKIAPQNYNRLFLELRNHGESTTKSFCQNMASFLTPSCLSSLFSCPNLSCCNDSSSPQCLLSQILGSKDYGKHEHKDIIGAIMEISKRTQGKPIILFGWCSGAFFSARTLIKLQQLKEATGINFFQKYNIQGLIFDSGFVSLKELDPQKYINKMSKEEKKEENQQENSFWSKIKSFFGGMKPTVLSGIAKLLKFFVSGEINKHDPKTRIDDKMNLLEGLPVWFIHSKEDYLAPFEDIQELQKKTPNSELWETEGECHAHNQLKHKNEYKEKMEIWLNKTVKKRVAPANNPDAKNQVFSDIIRIIDEIIGHIDSNSLQESAALQQQLFTKIMTHRDMIPEAALNIFQEILTTNPAMPAEELKNTLKAKLLEIKRILKAAQTQAQQNIGPEGQNDNMQSSGENPQQTQAFANIIRIIDEIIGHIDNPQNNSNQEKQRLLQKLGTELIKPANNVPQQALQLFQELIIKDSKNPGSVTDNEIKTTLLAIKRILQAAQTNTQNNTTEKSTMKLQAIIKLIDKIIEHLKKSNLNPDQELNKLLTKLYNALHNPANNAPEKAVEAFDEFMKQLKQNPDQFTRENMIDFFKRLRKYLEQFPNNKDKNKKPKDKPVNGKQKNQSFYPLAQGPSSGGNPNYTYCPKKKDDKKQTSSGGSSGSSSGSCPSSNYDNNSYPSNYDSYGNDYNQYPSQPSSERGSGSSSYGGDSNRYDNSWSGGNHFGTNNSKKESKGEETRPVTKYDFIFEDESYEDDPEMEDQPDKISYFDNLKRNKRRKRLPRGASN